MTKATWMGLMGAAMIVGVAGLWTESLHGQELGDFRVPEYTDEGIKKSEITGNSAKIQAGGVVDIKDFKIEFYEDDGETIKMAVKSPACTYNQRGRVAKSESDVRIEGPKMVVTGSHFAWDGQRDIFKIFKNAKVVIKGAGEIAKPVTKQSE